MSDQLVLSALNARLDGITFTPALTKIWAGDPPANTNPPIVWPFYSDVGNVPLSTCPVQHRAERTYGVRCFVGERQGQDDLLRLKDAVSDRFFPADGTLGVLTAGSIRVQINRKPDWRPIEPRGGLIGGTVLIRCFFII